jgi:hypothetical protein
VIAGGPDTDAATSSFSSPAAARRCNGFDDAMSPLSPASATDRGFDGDVFHGHQGGGRAAGSTAATTTGRLGGGAADWVQLFREADVDGQGRLSLAQVHGLTQRLVQRLDIDGESVTGDGGGERVGSGGLKNGARADADDSEFAMSSVSRSLRRGRFDSSQSRISRHHEDDLATDADPAKAARVAGLGPKGLGLPPDQAADLFQLLERGLAESRGCSGGSRLAATLPIDHLLGMFKGQRGMPPEHLVTRKPVARRRDRWGGGMNRRGGCACPYVPTEPRLRLCEKPGLCF